MADRFQGFEQRQQKRWSRIDGKKVYVHDGREVKRIFIDPSGVPQSETASESGVPAVCHLCSQEIDIHNIVWLLDRTYHRTPCLARIVEEILDVAVEQAGGIDTDTLDKGASTIAMESIYTRTFLSIVGDKLIRSIVPEILDSWKAARLGKVKPTTFNIEKRSL